MVYTPAQVQSLTPIRETVEASAIKQPDLRDVFLCHAWDDRQGAAKELHDLLEEAGVRVWFSEKDLALGVPMMRAIDKGLVNSRIGLVLVTPALLTRLPKEGVADKELSALLASNQLVPIVHNTTYDALRDVSPLLASRSGLDTTEDSMKVVAQKIAELVAISRVGEVLAPISTGPQSTLSETIQVAGGMHRNLLSKHASTRLIPVFVPCRYQQNDKFWATAG